MATIGNVWESVGNTPLIKIKSLSAMTGCEIYGKAEFLNPGGSIKDRAAKGIISAAELSGELPPGGTIVEGTAGNTGIGLATLAAERGYPVVIFMPNNQAAEKFQMLQALGAQVHAVAPCPFSNQQHFYHQARAYAQANDFFWADQFENTANGLYHYESTGPELWNQLEGHIDELVAAVGTGGTLGGTSRYLKDRNRNIQVVACDPMGSGVFHFLKEGSYKSEGSSVTEGIGIMRKTANFGLAQIDEALQVDDHQMINMMFHLAQKDGLFLGTSSALNLYGAFQVARRHQGSGKKIVTFLCDHGSRYASRVLDKDWLAEKGFQPAALV